MKSEVELVFIGLILRYVITSRIYILSDKINFHKWMWAFKHITFAIEKKWSRVRDEYHNTKENTLKL